MITSAAREETIFHIARQLTHPNDRSAYLDDACGDNKALRQRIERLLQAESRADKLFPDSPKEPSPGDVLGDYEIIEKIGGNMGLVFKARHRLLDKAKALKLLPPEHSIDPTRLARFRRELQVMAQLEHPNLVAATDARVVDCWHMVAMEWIDGMDLQKVIETQGPLPVAPACEAVRQAALGLQCAHEHGLIHRDIKPSNLMVTQSGVIKVIDMGLALVRDASTVPVTEPGMVLGTMRYCAPEQYRDASSVDTRADIYSMGCTLYQLLAGNPPYAHRNTLPEVMQAHLREHFPKLRTARSDAPERLETVLTRMTAKDPRGRFATPGEVAEALAPFARGGDTKLLLANNAVPATMPAGQPPPAKRPGRVIAAVVLLLALLGAAFLAGSFRERERERARVQEQERSRAQEQERAQERQRALDAERAKEPRPDPIVVLMDTTAKRGIYDEENRDKGISNTEVLKNKVLRDLPLRVYPLNISIDAFELQWRGENYVITLQADLVIIHRSVFFHPLNAVLELDYPPFTDPAASTKWERLYAAADDKLIAFMANVRSASPRTKFLVYSTGTDKRWMDEDFRKQWTEHIGARFPALKGQVRTMEIRRRPDGTRGTFQDADTAEDMRNRVKTILGFSDP